MKKQKIEGEEGRFLYSSNNYEDDDCPVCRLMRKAEKEGRDPTREEVEQAIREARNTENKIGGS